MIFITVILIGVALYVGILYGKPISIWLKQLFKNKPSKISKEDIVSDRPYDKLRDMAENGSKVAQEAIKAGSIIDVKPRKTGQTTTYREKD